VSVIRVRPGPPDSALLLRGRNTRDRTPAQRPSTAALPVEP